MFGGPIVLPLVLRLVSPGSQLLFIVGGLRPHIHPSLRTVLYRVSYDDKSVPITPGQCGPLTQGTREFSYFPPFDTPSVVWPEFHGAPGSPDSSLLIRTLGPREGSALVACCV